MSESGESGAAVPSATVGVIGRWSATGGPIAILDPPSNPPASPSFSSIKNTVFVARWREAHRGPGQELCRDHEGRQDLQESPFEPTRRLTGHASDQARY